MTFDPRGDAAGDPILGEAMGELFLDTTGEADMKSAKLSSSGIAAEGTLLVGVAERLGPLGGVPVSVGDSVGTRLVRMGDPRGESMGESIGESKGEVIELIEDDLEWLFDFEPNTPLRA